MIERSASIDARKDVLVFGVLALTLALVLAAPMLVHGAVFGDDIFFHVLYNKYFSEQLRAGDWYPRWLFNGNAGLGAPVFFFYGSAPSFATSLFSGLGLGIRYQLGLAAFIAILASGAAAYLWARMLVRAPAAATAALIYMAHPYHLNIDLYMRFAYAEFWSFVWMPLVLAAMVATARERPRAWLLGAVSYAVLLGTHPPTVLIFTLVLVPYAACTVLAAPKPSRIRIAAKMTGSLVLGVTLAGLYLVPALTTQAYASYAETFHSFGPTSFLDYAATLRKSLLFAHAWSYGVEGSWKAVYADATALSLVLVVACVGAATGRPKIRAAVGSQSSDSASSLSFLPFFWGAVALVAALAMTRMSLPGWEFARGLQRIQFPTRLNFVLVLALVPLVAYGVDRTRAGRSVKVVSATIVALCIATFWVPAAKEIRWGLAKYGAVDDVGAAIMPPETRPATVPVELAGVDAITNLARRTPRAAFSSGVGRVSVAAWAPDGIRIDVDHDRPDTLVLHQFAYPGWRVDTSPSVPVVVSASPEGLLALQLPRGTYRLTIQRGMLPAEQIGLALSSGACVVALGALIASLRRRPIVAAPGARR